MQRHELNRQNVASGSSQAATGTASRLTVCMLANPTGGYSFVVGPHTQNANRFFFNEDLVDDTVLNIDAAGIGAVQITD